MSIKMISYELINICSPGAGNKDNISILEKK